VYLKNPRLVTISPILTSISFLVANSCSYWQMDFDYWSLVAHLYTAPAGAFLSCMTRCFWCEIRGLNTYRMMVGNPDNNAVLYTPSHIYTTGIVLYMRGWCNKFCCGVLFTHYQELMKSVGSHGSLSLLFVMKVMVWHFMSDSHRVLATLIIMLSCNRCCGDFSAVS